MRVGLSELVFILLFIVFFVNPEKMPEYAEKLRVFIRKLKDITAETNATTNEMKNAVNDVVGLDGKDGQ